MSGVRIGVLVILGLVLVVVPRLCDRCKTEDFLFSALEMLHMKRDTVIRDPMRYYSVLGYKEPNRSRSYCYTSGSAAQQNQ